ncbi:MAG: leucine-rich repeat protein, partial [Ruminococcus sp.]|nr:leucine-rich repeat protein [Ruminococcus sp.]
MKKIISTLAALSVICGSFCTVMPVAAADTDTVAVAESENTKEFDLDKFHSSSEADGIVYNVYSDFAVVTRVKDEDIEEFTVPDTYKDVPVVGVTDGPFRDCKKLKKINLSKNVAVFEWINVAEEGIAEVTVPEDNKFFTSVDGIIYSKDKKELVCCPTACGKTKLVIPEETESIKFGALICCRDLKEVEMGSKLETIRPSAFWGCSGLEHIT